MPDPLKVADKVLKLAADAIADFAMIRDGDRIAVGVSGGKDSLALLQVLLRLQQRAPVHFAVEAFSIDQGKFLKPINTLKPFLDKLGVRWTCFVDQPSLNLIAQSIEHGCDLCSRYRRRAVYEVAQKLNCSVIALGHTADDSAEALIRNIMFTGRATALSPIASSSKGQFRIIRPLIYVREALTARMAEDFESTIVPCVCSLNGGFRHRIRGFIGEMESLNRHVHPNIVSAGVELWRLGRTTMGARGGISTDSEVAAPSPDFESIFEDDFSE